MATPIFPRMVPLQRAITGRAVKYSSFSTSVGHSSQIPPESPKYVDFPQSIQPHAVPFKETRGALPMPRRLALSRKPQMTSSRRALGATNQDEAARNSWRQRMTDTRQKNLTEGYSELQARNAEAIAARAANRSKRDAQDRRNQQRLDSLNEITFNNAASMLRPLDGADKRLPDPERGARLQQMRAHVDAKELGRTRLTKNSLHNLYMNARDFIVNDTQLDQSIERAFGTPNNPTTWNSGPSVWHERSPETIEEMLNKANQAREATDDERSTGAVSRERLRKLAEALTGGKI